jgi:hypothetical protein
MLPDHVFATKNFETGGSVPANSEGTEFLPEVEYGANFSYLIAFTAETKVADTGGGSGGGSGSGGTPPAPAAPVIVQALNVSLSTPFQGVSCTAVSADTIKITGSYRTAFDDSYQFVRKTGGLVILPPDTTETDIALVKYTMPSQTRRLFEYPVTVQWPEGASWEGTPIATIITIKQWARWTTTIAAAEIAKLKVKKI